MESVHLLPSVGEILKAHGKERLKLLVLAIYSFDAGELSALYHSIRSVDPETRIGHAAATHLILDRWLVMAPDQVITQVKNEKTLWRPWNPVPSMESLMLQFAAVDLPAALEKANELSGIYPHTLCRDHFRVLAVHDPIKALRHVHRAGDHERSAYAGIIDSWVKTDPDAAVEWVSNHANTVIKVDLLNALADSNNVDRAVVVAMGMTHPALIGANRFVAAWKERDEVAAGAWLGSLAVDQASALQVLEDREIRQWMYGNKEEQLHPRFVLSAIAAAGDHLTVLDPNMNSWRQLGSALSSTLRAVAKEDPHAARQYVKDIPQGLISSRAIEGLVEGWAVSDPEAALAFTQKLPLEFDRRKRFRLDMEHTVMKIWAKNRPAEAAAYIESMGKDPDVARMIAAAWVEQDQEEAIVWMLSKPEELQQQLINASLGTILHQDLATGFELMERLSEDQRQSHVGSAMSAWIEEDPSSAAEWMREYANEPRFGAQFGNLVNKWTKQDIEAAVVYVTDLSPGENRDRGISALALRLAERDEFESAWEWARKLKTEEFDGSRTMILNAWSNKDSAAAERAREDITR
jgi:hypothetical protein